MFLSPLVLLTISACASTPVAPIMKTQVRVVHVAAYVPLDAALTAEVPISQPLPVMTNRDLLELAIARGNELKLANSQLRKIRDLQPKTD